MKILVVDREDITAQMIAARLEPVGHKITYEANKTAAPDRMARELYDVVFIDPSPLTNGRSSILNIRRAVPKYPYMVLLGQSGTQADAIKAGCNDFLAKPLDPEEVDRKIENALRLTRLITRIKDDSEDFPSAGGVIAKSAFNQLFLSAIDRADRYGERSFVLFICLNNFAHIAEKGGAYAGDYAAAALSKNLVNLRRQSDIIGQTASHEYALLLQRPSFDTEPAEAAARFAEALGKIQNLTPEGMIAEIKVTLVSLPVGEMLAEHIIRCRPQ